MIQYLLAGASEYLIMIDKHGGRGARLRSLSDTLGSWGIQTGTNLYWPVMQCIQRLTESYI